MKGFAQTHFRGAKGDTGQSRLSLRESALRNAACGLAHVNAKPQAAMNEMQGSPAMNCQLARNRILAVEEPGELPEELAQHLEVCDACRAWARLFAQMDQALLQLPVPLVEGVGKTVVLERIRAGKPATAAPVLPQAELNHKPVNGVKPMPVDLEDDLPKKKFKPGAFAARYWPAGLIAATLLIGVVAWLSLRGQKPQQPTPQPGDPLLESVVRLNVELAKTQTPAERVDVLTKLADELNQEMRDIARADGTGDNMQALEHMYRKVVLQGLIAQAKLIERSKREAILGRIADNLALAGKSADQSAAESPEHSAARLRNAAEIAREGVKEIRLLIKEASL